MYSNTSNANNYGFANYQPAGPLGSVVNYQTQYNQNYSPMSSNYSPVSYNSQNKSFNSSGYYSSGSDNSFTGSPASFNYFSSTAPFSYNNTQMPAYHVAPYNQKPSIPVYQKDTPERNVTKRPRDTENLIDEIFQSRPDGIKRVKTIETTRQQLPVEQSNNEDDFDENDLSAFDSNGKKRVLTKEQRKAANQRERKRMNIMNTAFSDLRSALPISTGRKRRKMSRLDIVIGAMEYIDYLNSLLETPGNGPVEINFEAYQNTLYEYFQDQL